MQETDSSTWLTQLAHDRLKHELDELVAKRPVIAAKINDAREEGDLKEEGGYHAAREEQGQLELRIRQLQELLRVAKFGEAPAESGVAQPGMVVTVRYEGAEEDETETFLLGSREKGAHGDLEVYSPNSPLGKAIIGAHEGEDRKYELPNGGSMTVTVIKADPFTDSYAVSNKHSLLLDQLREDAQLQSRPSLRTAQLSIYTSSDDPPTQLVRAVHDLLMVCDIEIEHEYPTQHGSWFKSWSMREKRPAALDKLTELVEKAERAAELKYIQAQRAQSDELEANAVATVINSLNNIESAIIQLSSVIIVKSDSKVVSRVLSEKELSALREHPDLLKSPQDILTILPQIVQRSQDSENSSPLDSSNSNGAQDIVILSEPHARTTQGPGAPANPR